MWWDLTLVNNEQHSTATPTASWACKHPLIFLLGSIQIRFLCLILSLQLDALILCVLACFSWDVCRVNIYVEAHCLWLQLSDPVMLPKHYLQQLAHCGPHAGSPATTEWTLDPKKREFLSPGFYLYYYATHICCTGSKQSAKLALCIHCHPLSLGLFMKVPWGNVLSWPLN